VCQTSYSTHTQAEVLMVMLSAACIVLAVPLLLLLLALLLPPPGLPWTWSTKSSATE
jgi:hypothetical protein